MSEMNLKEAIRMASDRMMSNPNFIKWFGKSVVKDETGAPLKVFHGTTAPDFESFAKDKIGSRTDNGYFGKGFSFTSDPEYAGIYAGEAGYGKFENGARLIPAHIKIEKPYHVPWKDEGRRITEDPEAFTNKLKAEGYDGIVVQKNPRYGDWNEYTVFEPTQIKSAIGNRGTFDPNDPNILKGAAVATGLGASMYSPEAAQARQYKDRAEEEALEDSYSPVDMIQAAAGGGGLTLRAARALIDPVINYGIEKFTGK